MKYGNNIYFQDESLEEKFIITLGMEMISTFL